MATPSYYLCDRCGKQTDARLSLPVLRQMDAAGSMETDYNTIDLCCGCLKESVLYFLRSDADNCLDHEKCTMFIKRWKR